jgi:hypothetical protein
MRENGLVVFRPEASAQALSGFSALSQVQRNHNDDDQDDRNRARNQSGIRQFWIHFRPPGR